MQFVMSTCSFVLVGTFHIITLHSNTFLSSTCPVTTKNTQRVAVIFLRLSRFDASTRSDSKEFKRYRIFLSFRKPVLMETVWCEEIEQIKIWMHKTSFYVDASVMLHTFSLPSTGHCYPHHTTARPPPNHLFFRILDFVSRSLESRTKEPIRLLFFSNMWLCVEDDAGPTLPRLRVCDFRSLAFPVTSSPEIFIFQVLSTQFTWNQNIHFICKNSGLILYSFVPLLPLLTIYDSPIVMQIYAIF